MAVCLAGGSFASFLQPTVHQSIQQNLVEAAAAGCHREVFVVAEQEEVQDAAGEHSSYLFIVLPEGGVLRPPVRPLAAALKTPSAFRPPALALFSSCTDKARGGSSPIAGPC